MEVIVSGASGLIGTHLADALRLAGHRPVALVRRPTKGADEIHWDPADGEIDADALEGCDAVVHLAGASIGGRRWNADYKQLVLESRTSGTSLLAATLAGLNTAPRAFLSGSAIGYYGDRGAESMTEASSSGDGFLAEVCRKWEAAAQSAIDAGIRTAFLRTGIVLTPTGGVLPKFLPLFKFGLGGKFGDGSQYMSWISLTDEIAAILFLLDNEVDGPVNLTAPDPVTNAEFTEVLGDVLGRPTLLPVPAFGPRILLGREMADALLFDSTRVLPTTLHDAGFAFSHPDLEAGLRSELNR